MKNKWLLLVIWVWLLVACGEGGSGSTIAPPTLTIVASNLDNMLDSVPTGINPIEITVKENLKPESINTQTVHLMPQSPGTHDHAKLDLALNSGITNENSDVNSSFDAVQGNVSFDPILRKITFKPLKPLAEGKTYHIRVHNAELSDGRKITVTTNPGGEESGVIQFSFTTSHNHEVLRVRYDQQGIETSYVTFRIENNKLMERRQFNKQKQRQLSIHYDIVLAGTSRFATALHKDKSDANTLYEYNVIENGNVVANVRVKDAGTDLVWGTDDDLVISWTERNQQHVSHEIVKSYSLVDQNKPVVWAGPSTPGFQVRTIYLEERLGPNFRHRDVFYRSFGPNGVLDIDPVTQDLTVIDDEISLWYKQDYLADGKRARTWSINGTASTVNGRGVDGLLFTLDDIATGLTTLEYYPDDLSVTSGKLKELVTYYSERFSAPINEWIQPDNATVRSDAVVHGYSTYNYDLLTGDKTEVLQYSPGRDGKKATADDYLVQRVYYSTKSNIDGNSLIGIP